MKPGVLNKCKTSLQIASIDLDRKENLLPLSDVKLAFGAKTIITKAKRKDSVTNQEVAKFKREGYLFVTSVVKKRFERSPNKRDFVNFVRFLILLSFYHVERLLQIIMIYCRNDLNRF